MSLNPELVRQFQSFVEDFMSQTAVTKVDGDYFDLPGTVVYTQAKKSLPEKGRLEINVSDPSVRDRFTWNAEITLDRRSNDIFKHILLNGDGSVVETYGKRVIEVTDETAAELLNQLATAAKL